ncbi:type II toxin-antitoxin system RelE/ParE family toxin [Desulfoluna sp.]|uniref:type II toxin-antitoxin system RelE/ParE family toxin n=1 Tax=Desulfoluna sp. TaxID=2045199 RepID=UPI002608B8D1|nr:type II toxin-antitoxin system RelE/ParE family toxin [Desulfoluna sp.]
MLLKWTHAALKNIDDAVEYISQDRPDAAKKVARKIWSAANSLIDHPELGRPGRVLGTRELIVTGLPFILPYTIKDQTIIILRVMHTSRKWLSPDISGKGGAS